jgi:hypothetical protein
MLSLKPCGMSGFEPMISCNANVSRTTRAIRRKLLQTKYFLKDQDSSQCYDFENIFAEKIGQNMAKNPVCI